MLVCPAPWCAPRQVVPGRLDAIRPVAVTESRRAPLIGGFRDRARPVCGAPGSFELPRPLLAPARQAARVEGSQLRLAVQPDEESGGAEPGVILASRAAAVSAWLEDPVRSAVSTCTSLRARLLAELGASDAPESLAVEIARKHRFPINEVYSDPRVQLRRRREVQHVDRVRQLDAASLRWISRQPGRTFAERAGPRERILAVRRFRSVDTLENQVLVDVIRRSVVMAEEYDKLYRSFRNSERLRDVRELGRSFRELRDRGWAPDVRRLPGVPVPNYALLGDRRYSKVWKLWQRLLRQDELFQSLEAWLPRLVAELAWIGLLAEIESQESFRPALGAFPDLRFRPEFEYAEFLNQSQGLPPAVHRPGAPRFRVDVARGDCLMSDPTRQLPAGRTPWSMLSEVRPDLALVARPTDAAPPRQQACIAVWSVATWNALDCTSLSSAAEEIPGVIDRFGQQGVKLLPVLVVYRGAGPRFDGSSLRGVTVLAADAPTAVLAEVPTELARMAREAFDAR